MTLRAMTPPDDATRDLPFTTADFRKIAAFAHAEAGILLPDAKEPLVYSRLVKRLRQLGLPSFAEYVALLQDPDGAEERRLVISALTTNTTRFYRENHHFEFFAQTVLPPLVARARQGARVRLWSAACSSGEEPYCMAFALLQQCPEAARLDIKILATDIDAQILATAERGVYPDHVLVNLPEAVVSGYFAPPDRPGAARQVQDGVRALINFRPLNLIQPWPVKGPFDAVFCRNVAIYFDADTQDHLWRGFAATLAPGGYLFIGHSERLSASVKGRFDIVGMTTYRLHGGPPDTGFGHMEKGERKWP